MVIALASSIWILIIEQGSLFKHLRLFGSVVRIIDIADQRFSLVMRPVLSRGSCRDNRRVLHGNPQAVLYLFATLNSLAQGWVIGMRLLNLDIGSLCERMHVVFYHL